MFSVYKIGSVEKVMACLIAPWMGLDEEVQPIVKLGRGVATCTQIRNCVPENNNKKK